MAAAISVEHRLTRLEERMRWLLWLVGILVALNVPPSFRAIVGWP